jgi:hypothetical protein
MGIEIEKNDFDLREGYRYYVSFKPNALEQDDPHARVPVDVAMSVCENGDLADMSFELPKYCRNNQALAYIEQQEEAQFVSPRVFVVRPGCSGDAVVSALGHLEVDLAGRIIGMEIQWLPTRGAQA